MIKKKNSTKHLRKVKLFPKLSCVAGFVFLVLFVVGCNQQATPTATIAVQTAAPQPTTLPTPTQEPALSPTETAAPPAAAAETDAPTATPTLPPTLTPTPTIPTAVVEVEEAVLPPGFSMIRFAPANRPTALAFDEEGRLYATSNDGSVTVFMDEDGDGRSDSETLFYQDFFIPLGITVRPGTADVYVSSRGQINILRDTNGDLRADENTLFVRGLPRDWHQNNNLKFGPDGMLYVTIGSTCDACQEEDPRSATIMRFDPETAEGEIIATGLRNPYDLAFHPVTGDLFATDNGRDDLGDEAPKDELNHIIEGQDYGWPDCWDELVGPGCEGTTAAFAFFEPRASTNSLDFYVGGAFPVEYEHVEVFPYPGFYTQNLYPAIDGDSIVWMHYRECCGWDLLHFDLDSRTTISITNDGWQNTEYWPDVSGDWVVWNNGSSQNGDIHAYNMATTEHVTVTQDSFAQWYPKIDGNLLTWTDSRRGSQFRDIYGFDMETRQEFPLVVGENPAYAQDIDGNILTWYESINGPASRIYGRNLDTGETSLIYETIPPSIPYGPTFLSGSIVLWVFAEEGNYTEPRLYGARRLTYQSYLPAVAKTN